MKVKTLKEAQARYGVIEFGKWKDEVKWMAIFKVPEDIAVHWMNSASGQPTRKIYCNKDLHAPLAQALKNIQDRNLKHQLDTFDGCFMIRQVRGSAGLSTHSYGLAIDINAKDNGLGVEPKISKELVKCFTDAGFDWGGNFSRKDGMHLSFCWEGKT